jgi:hypothetical protein
MPIQPVNPCPNAAEFFPFLAWGRVIWTPPTGTEPPLTSLSPSSSSPTSSSNSRQGAATGHGERAGGTGQRVSSTWLSLCPSHPTVRYGTRLPSPWDARRSSAGPGVAASGRPAIGYVCFSFISLMSPARTKTRPMVPPVCVDRLRCAQILRASA